MLIILMRYYFFNSEYIRVGSCGCFMLILLRVLVFWRKLRRFMKEYLSFVLLFFRLWLIMLIYLRNISILKSYLRFMSVVLIFFFIL